MTERERWRRTALFEKPDRIPMRAAINGSCWAHYGAETVWGWLDAHPTLFPWAAGRDRRTFKPGFDIYARANQPATDPWGSVWVSPLDGIHGAVTQHPLADWSAFAGYAAPDPDKTNGMTPVDWNQAAEHLAAAKARGDVAWGGLPHGHTFLRLTYLRGYENLILDMAEDAPELPRLIRLVTDFNRGVIERMIKAGAEIMSYPEDLGMQSGPMLSPDQFERYILPAYREIMAPAREAGLIIHMHSDGDIRTLAKGLTSGGVQILNLQDLVNGVDWIKATLKGKVCLEVDIDRQSVTVSGTPAAIDAHLRTVVRELGSREGGLALIYGVYPGTPAANVSAVLDAMVKYADFYA